MDKRMAFLLGQGLVDCGRWFLSFGTMLHFIRATSTSRMNPDSKVSWCGTGDIDIGVIGSHENLFNTLNTMGNVVHRHKINGEIWQQTWDIDGISVDVYKFVPNKGYYWHSYANLGQEIPEKEFKAVKQEYFSPSQAVITKARENPLHPYSMTKTGEWALPVPEYETEGITMPIPFKYGSLMDAWYPNWALPDPQFGVSHAEKTVKLTDTKNLMEKLK